MSRRIHDLYTAALTGVIALAIAIAISLAIPNPDVVKILAIAVGSVAVFALMISTRYALTLTIPALCSAKKMICIVPEKRKAEAVKAALRGPISTACPGSFLRKQAHCLLYLDAESAGLL